MIWLTVQEADTTPAQRDSYFRATSADTVRPIVHRQARAHAAQRLDAGVGIARGAQAAPDADAIPRGSAGCGSRAPPREKGNALGFNPVGQIVGRMNEMRSVKEVVYQLVEEYLAAVERLDKLTSAQTA